MSGSRQSFSLCCDGANYAVGSPLYIDSGEPPGITPQQ